MEKHDKIKTLIENAIIDGITYKDEMIAIGRGYDLGSIAELCTREIERALAEPTHDAPAGGLSKHAVINCVAVPEWLTTERRAEAKMKYNSHGVEDNNRVKAVEMIRMWAGLAGYTIGLKKASELLQQHCL